MIATSAVLDELRRPAPAPRRPSVIEALRRAPLGSVTPARDRGRSVALVVLADRRAFVVDDRCPHDGGPLSNGFVDGDRLVCARHGWEIDPCNGSCPRGAIDTRRIR